VGLKIVVGFIQRLPDSIEVGFVARAARHQRGRLRQRYHAKSPFLPQQRIPFFLSL
jgi:hypothetical protein